MAPRVVVLLALLGVVIAAPQLYLSEKSHLGLEQALGGRVPVGVYSANKIYKGYEGEGSDVIVLNIPGLSHPVGREDFLLNSHESNELLPSTRTAGAAILSVSAGPATRTGPAFTAVVDSLEDSRDILDSAEDTVGAPRNTGAALIAVLDSLEDPLDLLNSAEDARDSLEDEAEDAAELALTRTALARGGVPLSAAAAAAAAAPTAAGGVPLSAVSPAAAAAAAPAAAGGVPLSAVSPAAAAVAGDAAAGGGVPLSAAAANAGRAAATGPAAAVGGGVPLGAVSPAAAAATPGAAAGGGVPLSAISPAAASAAGAAAGGGVPLSAASPAAASFAAGPGGAAAAPAFGGLLPSEVQEELLEARQDALELEGLRRAAAAAAASGNTLLAGQLMREAVEEAAEAAREAAEDAAELEATRRAAAAAAAAGNNLLAGQLMAEAAEEAAKIALQASSNANVARNMARFTQEVALRARQAAAEAAEDARELQQDAAEDAAEAALNARLRLSQGAANIGGVPLPAVVRRKRSFGSSDDDEDDPFSTTRAEDGAFALSSLGILLGSNLGRWFDDTYDANVKFFRGLEITGNLVLTQLDAMLEEDKN